MGNIQAKKIIQQAESKGVELYTADGKIKCEAPKGELSDQFIADLKQNKQQVIQLLNDPQSIEDILLSLTDQVDKVQLEGKQYHASNLVRLILDFPCKLAWEDESLKIKPGDYEDWDWFRSTFLKPNTEQIKELFQLAQQEYGEQIKQALR